MAKSRKPAIGGLARPEGFLDDMVYPLAQKATRAIGRRALSKGNSKGIMRSASATSKIATARAKSYGKKSLKAYDKSYKANTVGDSLRRAENKMVKGNVLKAKQEAARNIGNVRKAAEFARANNRQTIRNARSKNVMKMKGLR